MICESKDLEKKIRIYESKINKSIRSYTKQPILAVYL